MANVIVRPGWQAGDQGSVMLVDLGIARGLESSAAGAYAAGMMVGSAPYVAPELLAPAGELGPAGALDTFALGVLTFLLLFRRHPTGLPMTAGFDEFLQAWRTTGVVYPEPERVAAINAEVPGLLQVAEKCMAFSPRDRFANALRLYDALRVLVEQPARPAPAPAEELAAPPAASVSAPSPAPMVAPPPVTADSESDKWKTLAVVLAGFIAVAAATIAGVIWVLR
jgi:serine/threonine-protein kinase